MRTKIFRDSRSIHLGYVITLIVISVAIVLSLFLLPYHVETKSVDVIFIEGVTEVNHNEYTYSFNISGNGTLLHNIKVKVFNPKNGTLVEGARVRIYGEYGNGENFTDRNGIADIPVKFSIPPESKEIKFNIEVKKDGYRTLSLEDAIVFIGQ